MARLARSLEKLLEEVNTLAPSRSKASDGWIGDQSHQVRQSDHNPNSKGVVTAIDITHDPANGLDCNVLAEALRNSRDPRIKYVIFNKRAFDPYNLKGNWNWQPYSGSNPHTKHLHLSVRGDYDNTAPWQIGGEEMITEADARKLQAVYKDIANKDVEAGVREIMGKQGYKDFTFSIGVPYLQSKAAARAKDAAEFKKQIAELSKRPTQTQLDALRDELKKVTDQNVDLANKLKEAENKPPVVVDKTVDDSKRSAWDLISAGLRKLLGVK